MAAPHGRVMVFNRRHKFSRSDLRWFEHIIRHISPQIDNVYRMRHLRARAVEAERSRISRDLHDGILQTLLEPANPARSDAPERVERRRAHVHRPRRAAKDGAP